MSLPTVKTENKYGLDWVLLNNRWYCVQNYSPTHLADGTPIPVVTGNATWVELTTPARCVYNNSADAEFIAKYGYLYNWYGVDEGLEMPCAGCVVPSPQEWAELANWMIAKGFNWDGTTEGDKIGKALASDGGEWQGSAIPGNIGNDQSSNNSSGLNFLPAGFRSIVFGGTFDGIGNTYTFYTTEIGNQKLLRHTDANFASNTTTTAGVGRSLRISATAPIVTFNSNGGSAVDDEVTFIGELATAPDAPTRAGYTFGGWYSDEALTTEWGFATDTVTEDTTLYAGWVEKKRSRGHLGINMGVSVGI